MKKVIKMGVLKAKVTLVCGDYDDVKGHLDSDAFPSEGHYLARCCFRHEGFVKYPFHVMIHSKSAAISVIAHEASHAADFIMEAMGEEPNFASELRAYIIQEICQEAEKLLNTYGSKSKKK